ncbi:MAG: hypothetical protein AAF487_12025 [Bacteroidota bacterium]
MGLPKKGSRVLQIDDCTYRYIVSGNDDTIDLIIELEDGKGQRFMASFYYHHMRTEKKTIKGESYSSLTQRNQITPGVVKEVIEYGIQNGWKPEKPGKELRLNLIDDKINLNLLANSDKG